LLWIIVLIACIRSLPQVTVMVGTQSLWSNISHIQCTFSDKMKKLIMKLPELHTRRASFRLKKVEYTFVKFKAVDPTGAQRPKAVVIKWQISFLIHGGHVLVSREGALTGQQTMAGLARWGDQDQFCVAWPKYAQDLGDDLVRGKGVGPHPVPVQGQRIHIQGHCIRDLEDKGGELEFKPHWE